MQREPTSSEPGTVTLTVTRMPMYRWTPRVRLINAETEDDALAELKIQLMTLAMASIEDLKRVFIIWERVEPQIEIIED